MAAALKPRFAFNRIFLSARPTFVDLAASKLGDNLFEFLTQLFYAFDRDEDGEARGRAIEGLCDANVVSVLVVAQIGEKNALTRRQTAESLWIL